MFKRGASVPHKNSCPRNGCGSKMVFPLRCSLSKRNIVSFDEQESIAQIHWWYASQGFSSKQARAQPVHFENVHWGLALVSGNIDYNLRITNSWWFHFDPHPNIEVSPRVSGCFRASSWAPRKGSDLAYAHLDPTSANFRSREEVPVSPKSARLGKKKQLERRVCHKLVLVWGSRQSA